MNHFRLYLIIASILALMLKILFMVYLPNLQNISLYMIFIFGGIPQILKIIYKFFQGEWGADLLAVLAMFVGILLKEYVATTLIILMLASGQYLEDFATQKATSSLSSLLERMPKLAHVLRNKKIHDLPLKDIQIGDIVIVYPFETCPVDGIIQEGHTNMDESYLTGEPYKISKAPGSTVFSGAINGENLIHVQSTHLAKDSRYENIVKVIQDAQQKKPKIKRLADKLGGIFTPIALSFASACYFWTHDAHRFLSILVTATPCPLLIAIPITIISAISLAAKNSIIIKDPSVLEELPLCQTAIFDKTGTLTLGKPELTKIHLLGHYSDLEILQYNAVLSAIPNIR